MSRLNVLAMMNEEVKEEMYEVVIDGQLIGEFNEEDTVKIVEFIKSLKGSTPKTSTPKTSAPKKLVATTPKTEEENKYPSIEPKVADEKKFMATSLVSVYYEDRKYKAFFNYKTIGRMAIDKTTKKKDDRKYEYLKDMFKKEIKEYGAEWISYNPEDKEDPRGWYQFPKKANAEQYREARIAKDKEYEAKRK